MIPTVKIIHMSSYHTYICFLSPLVYQFFMSRGCISAVSIIGNVQSLLVNEELKSSEAEQDQAQVLTLPLLAKDLGQFTSQSHSFFTYKSIRTGARQTRHSLTGLAKFKNP